MCGLAGIFNLNGAPVDPAVLADMNDRLAHRGPDDSGLTLVNTSSGRVHPGLGPGPGLDLGLASRRLAILDLSPAGRMPMSSQDGRIRLVYNGEIYNYKELRAELVSFGRSFQTGTDTEVIIQAYQEWGPDCQTRFNGMWAFALYDDRNKSLFCSRDRFGIKPFYYYLDENVFVFASEIKSLLVHPSVPRRPDQEAMFNYLARSYRFVDGRPTTFFAGICQLKPGCWLEVGRDSRQQCRYWRLDPGKVSRFPAEADYIVRYRELLQDAVSLRLRSDVPLAAQLSGGLDSSAITALAAQSLGPGLPVFSAAYEVKPFDEREYITPTVDGIRARSTLVFPGPEDLPSTLPNLIRAFDEPVCTVTFFAHWQVMSEVSRQGFKVILNGHGADELAAGYYDHFLHYFGDLKQQEQQGRLKEEAAAWLANHGAHRAAQLDDYFRMLDQGLTYMQDYLRLFAPYEAALGPELAKRPVNGKPNQDIYPSLLTNRLYNELRFETVPAVLKAEDRTTMAHSIESRLPFLDYRLVEYMFSIPNRLKIQNGLGKFIQRQALKGVIPEKVRTRKEKVGFNAPSEEWFRGPFKNEYERLVKSSRLFDRGLLNKSRFQSLWEEHQAGRANHYQFLWQALNLELWLKEYFG